MRLFSFPIIVLLCLCQGAPKQPHWSFVPPVRPAIPKVKNLPWVRNPIDAFILSSLDKKGLAPSPQADKRTLIRRLTFDLIGLPPTPEEIAAFLTETSPDAYEKLVRRLLASPHYGERWGQHWLDVVRFAESNGYEHDGDRPQAWRYRDWVIHSLNEDKPYNQFLTEQIAGDLLTNHHSPLTTSDFDLRVATGFLRTGPQHITGGNLDTRETRQEWLTEAVLGIGNGVLGLTIGCARCHDHKYDPISQVEYYRLQANFAATANKDIESATPDEKKAYDEAVKAIKDKIKPIEQQIAEIEKPYREKLRRDKIEKLPPDYKAALAVESGKRTAEQKKLVSEANVQLNLSWDEVVGALNPPDKIKRAGLRRQIFALEELAPPPVKAAASVADEVDPAVDSHLLVRGDPHKPGQAVEPGFPSCLISENSNTPNRSYSSDKRPPRLALAEWLTQPNNPLTARVIVNRLWHYHFGRGIVGTPNDFGKNGQPPSHPELLDWLASYFVETGKSGNAELGGAAAAVSKSPNFPVSSSGAWSLKRMHYLIVTSNTYRQSSDFDPVKARIDPENRLLWRMNRKRLDAESLRDSILAASGTLNPEVGGPSVRILLEPEVYDTIFTESEPDNLWPVTRDAKQHNRRSVYLFRKRNVRLPMLAVFDQPDFLSSCAARAQSVHALQALTLVNSEFMHQQSRELAKRVLQSDSQGSNETASISRLYAMTFGRPPAKPEMIKIEKFLKAQTAIMRARNARGETVQSQIDLVSGIDRASFAAWMDLCLATLNLNEFLYVR